MKPPFHLAKTETLQAVGLSPVPEGEQIQRLASGLAELRGSMRSLAVMLDTCTRCGACAAQCHSYLGTGDPGNIPAARADLVRTIYRRYVTRTERLLARLGLGAKVDPEMVGRWLTYFYQCNECRRCARYCPMGIDTAEITIVARHLLSQIGLVPRFMQGVAANMQKTGNNMGIPRPALIDSVEFLEEELLEETGETIRIPVDQPGSEILYIPSSADFFTNVDTILGAAKVFHALGARWTIPSTVLEAANFGLLFNLDVMRQHAQRVKEAARAVGAATVIQGECGHGWRAARLATEAAAGPVPYRIVHVLDYVAENLERLHLKKLPMRATLHDPCNYVRGGGLVEQPRRILRACVEEFVEMTPNREDNFCCGGGSGLLMDELLDIRLKLGRKKAEQVAALGPIDYLAIPCSICKAQLPVVMEHHGMKGLAMGGLLDLVGKAIVPGPPPEQNNLPPR
ncbi:MAG: (Fe-S)-binding protein [Thermoguttaceae bacterium]